MLYQRKGLTLSIVLSLCLLAGCATPLNGAQKREMMVYEAKGLVIEDKSPAAGAWLGLLPGGGSFYAREYGLGVLNLLVWPYSIFWDPISGYDGSQSINYYATTANLRKLKRKEMTKLEDRLTAEEIDKKTYIDEKRKIEDKFSAD